MRVEVRSWDDADWPRAWTWLQPYWNHVANDFSPNTVEEFVEMKRQQLACGWLALGVYRDGELGGVLEGEPHSPVLLQIHIAFKRAFWGRQTTDTAVRLGLEYCWSKGYKKLWCVFYPTNTRLIGLIKRLGGTFEGNLFLHTKKDGRMVDMISYAFYRR